MRKKIITIITYITIVTFIGFLVVLSIDQYRAVNRAKAISNESDTNLLIQYKDKEEDDDDGSAVESRDRNEESESYLLPNAIKNQYIKVSPL